MCYFIGSFPTSLLVGKRQGVNLRRVGSGNLGATNVYRALGLKWFIVVFAIDALKGALAVGLAYLTITPLFMAPAVKMVFGLTAVAGHIWSVFAGFKGGKGVSTAFGVLAALAPVPTGMALLLCVGILVITRIMSMATLTAAFSLPVLMGVYGEGVITIAYSVVLSGLIVFSHRENIKRLMRGEERPLDFSKWREHR